MTDIHHAAQKIVAERAVAYQICQESDADIAAREALLDIAMGPGRKRKSSEKLRRGRLPAEGLAFAAKSDQGVLIGTVRLWNVSAGDRDGKAVDALMLGPLAVHPDYEGYGIGSKLMRAAIQEAANRGHGAILLVGDPEYYERFGFDGSKTHLLSMPGPYEKRRFQALEFIENYLLGAKGILKATGRKEPKSAQK